MAQDLQQLCLILYERGVLDDDGLERAIASRERSCVRFLARLLAEQGCDEGDLVAALAQRAGLPGIDLSRSVLSLQPLDLVPRAVAEADSMLPLSTEGGRLHVAMLSAEGAAQALDEVRFITGREVSTFLAIGGPLELAIAAAYDARERGEEILRGTKVRPGTSAPGKSKLTLYLPGESPHDPAKQARPGQVFANEAPRAATRPAGPRARAPAAEPEAAQGEPEALEAIDGAELGLLEIPAEAAADDPLALEISAAGDDAEEEVVGSLRVGPKRVLVVDDEIEIVRLLERALKSAGYAVETATDGKSAEEALAARTPDLVLLDAMLPHVNGFEICGRLKAKPRLRKVPVIMMSAVYRGWRFAQDARDACGADDYVEKPFHLKDVLRRVEERLAEGARKEAEAEKASAPLERGIQLLEAKKPQEARVELEKAVKEDPFSPRGQLALARALVELGDSFRAITAYERALELRPGQFPALRNLAGLYLGKGFRRKAAETLERAMQHAPDPPTRAKIREQILRLL